MRPRKNPKYAVVFGEPVGKAVSVFQWKASASSIKDWPARNFIGYRGVDANYFVDEDTLWVLRIMVDVYRNGTKSYKVSALQQQKKRPAPNTPVGYPGWRAERTVVDSWVSLVVFDNLQDLMDWVDLQVAGSPIEYLTRAVENPRPKKAKKNPRQAKKNPRYKVVISRNGKPLLFPTRKRARSGAKPKLGRPCTEEAESLYPWSADLGYLAGNKGMALLLMLKAADLRPTWVADVIKFDSTPKSDSKYQVNSLRRWETARPFAAQLSVNFDSFQDLIDYLDLNVAGSQIEYLVQAVKKG